MAGQNATAILIAGMHRSGTSALAGTLGKLGVPLGERLLEAGSDNPKGYWEHQDIVAVHERLLAALGSRWDDVRTLPADWLISDPARQAVKAIEAVVARDFAGKPLWAVKDPRLCRLLPLWFEALDRKNIRPVVLFMVRKPSEVAASIEARNHWHSPIGEMLWLRYVTEAESASRDVPRSVVVYEDLLAEPESTVAAALRVLSVEIAPVSAQTREAMAGFIDKHGRHHAHDSNEKPREKFSSIAKAAYESLLSIAHGKDAWHSLRKDVVEFERYWQREGEPIDAMADMAMKLAASAESEWIENKLLSSKLTAQILWSDEAQADREKSQAEIAELTSQLTAQLRWSNVAQADREKLKAEIAELTSQLTAQLRWSNEAQADREKLRVENAELLSKLGTQIRFSEEAHVQANTLQRDKSELLTKLQHAVSDVARVRQELATKLQDSTNERDRIATELTSAQDRRAALESELGAVYDSKSWRFTRPLRAVADMFKPNAGRPIKKDKGRP